MKIFKKVLLCMAIFALLSCLLGSCKEKNDGENSDGVGNTTNSDGGDSTSGNGTAGGDTSEEEFSPSGDGIIFSPDVQVTVIKTDEDYYGYINTITDKIYNLTGKFAATNSDNTFVTSKEIVVGETSRSVSREAKRAYVEKYNASLEEYEKKGFDTRFLRGFIIYSNGDSVAIYWHGDFVKPIALEYFVNKYLQKSMLCLEKGFAEVVFEDEYKLMKEEEEAKREEEYSKIAEKYGKEAEEAVRAHLAMFNEKFYLWLADLYDPGAYDAAGNPLGGGFYYSNSARDTAGYRIDLESTVQALNFLSSAGLISSTSEYAEYFPEKMQKEMVAFALSCQSSEDGYFYHPQWGENVQISRISRDLGWATTILSRFGAIPYWNTPNGVDGKYGAPGSTTPVSALTEPLVNSSVASVSKVIAASGEKYWTGSAHLATVEAWEEYLTNLTVNIRTNSYSIGNTVSSQSAQIKTRDRLAMENGQLPDADGNGVADGGYIETFERIFNSLQLENGLWEECSVEDGTVYYNAINGLMKISGAYNSLGVKINYAEEALRAAAFMVTYIGESDDGSDWADSKGKKPNGSVDVYNPWVCIKNILNNISDYGTAYESDKLRENVINTNAIEMITVTTRKIAMFKKSDGSYGYTWDYSPSNSQGAPASVPKTVEGDVNGGCIAFTGTYNNMAWALGFGGLKLFGKTDLYSFIDRASAVTHKVKDANVSFDGETIGDAPTEVSFSGSNGSATVVDDPREGVRGNVVSLDTVAGTGCSINLTKPDNNSTKSGICLEWDMAFTDVTVGSSTAFQIKLGKSYMFVIGVDTSGNLTIGDSSSTGNGIKKFFSAKFKASDWNSFKVEYYVLNATNKTTAAKIYVNGELLYVSDTYVSKDTEAAPSTSYNNVSFYALAPTDFTVQFDNIKAYDLVKKYQEETPKYTN